MTLLNQIKVFELLKFNIEDGNLLRGLRNNDEGFMSFGEAYFSFINYKKIKAWKFHSEMTMNLIVPSGRIKFVFFDEGTKKFRIEEIGYMNYSRIFVPPKVWFGFQGLEKNFPNVILNISNIIHSENEVKRIKKENINFNWD